MNRLGSTIALLACGALGAALSVTVLLLIPADGAPRGYGELIADDLPVLVLAAATGFGAGAMFALLGSLLQRLFAASAPRA